jgi:hypothetical protein
MLLFTQVGTSSFPVADVHRIGILDVRLMNMDRHAGNVLVRRASAADAPPGTLSLQVATVRLFPCAAAATLQHAGSRR